MKLVLLTNMPAYQQLELAKAFVQELGEANFRLGILGSLSQSRKQMGWQDDAEEPYIIRFDKSKQSEADLLHWIETADVVIQGRFPIKYLRERIKSGGLTYAYQERIWKKGFNPARLISRSGFLWKNYYSVNKPNYHLLAAGRYAATDLLRIGLFKGRAWKFGYFVEALPSKPKPSAPPLRLIWCGRFMALKRPQRAIELLGHFVESGIDASLSMIGGGDLEQSLRDQAEQANLSSRVEFAGWKSVEEVNQAMSAAHIMLMSSDHREGWGVVINEAINNGCFPVVSAEVGSAQWLIENQKTGIVYNDAEFAHVAADLSKQWSDSPERITLQASHGQKRLCDEWSTRAAAQRVIAHAGALLSNGTADDLFSSGPCSSADPRHT